MIHSTEDIKKILIDNLSKGGIVTHCKSNVLKEYYRVASYSLYVANIICGELGMTENKYVIQLATFIDQSWEDLEITDSQIDNIMKEISIIRKTCLNEIEL